MIILREGRNPFSSGRSGRTGLRESSSEGALNFRDNRYIPNIQRMYGLATTPKFRSTPRERTIFATLTAMGLRPGREGSRKISVYVPSIPAMAEVASIIFQQFSVRGTFVIPWNLNDEGGNIVYDENLLGVRNVGLSTHYTDDTGLPESPIVGYVV